MNKEPEKAQVPKAQAALTPNQILVRDWNTIVRHLIEVERLWGKHRLNYLEARSGIIELHPEVQRLFNRVIHRQPLNFFIEDIAREARTGFAQLLITEDKS